MAGANVAYPVAATELMVGLEAVRGTAAATTTAIPVKAPKYKPNLELIPDDTLQGSMVKTYNLTRGLRYDGHGWDSYPYMDNFPILVAAEFGSADNYTSTPSATTLSSSATLGASSISTVASVAAGSWFVLDTGGVLESHKVLSVSGTTSPYTLNLTYPLIYAHAMGATVTPLSVHQWSLLNNSDSTGNQPLSCTINDFDGEEWRQITAAQLDELTIKGNATGFVDYTCTWFGNPSVTPSSPTPTFTAIQPPPGWTCQVAIGGTYLNYTMSWEFNFKRSVTPVPALTGTEAYFLYFANELMADGKMTFVEQSGAPQMTQYLNGTQEVIDISMFDDRTGYVLDIHSTKAEFKTGEIDRSKSGPVEAVLEVQLLPTTTDALAGGVSPCIVTVANATASAYVGS